MVLAFQFVVVPFIDAAQALSLLLGVIGAFRKELLYMPCSGVNVRQNVLAEPFTELTVGSFAEWRELHKTMRSGRQSCFGKMFLTGAAEICYHKRG